MKFRQGLAGVAALLLFAAVGCRQEPGAAKAPKITEVTIAKAVSLKLPDFEFPGEIQAIESVEVRARVGGFLKKAELKEGTEVKQGDLLFEIDPDLFQADVERAQAGKERADKELLFAQAEVRRGMDLMAGKSISKSDYEKLVAEEGVKKANVLGAAAALQTAKLNLQYTKVTAPISGKLGRKLVTEGNLISGGTDKATLLTTIVSVEKMYGIFYVDERTAQIYRKDREKEGVLKPHIKVLLALNTDDNFPHEGVVDFSDNQVDPGTGTFLVRAVFDNTRRELVAGYTARVRVYIGDTKPSLVFSERALLSDRGQDFVYVMNDKKVVEPRNVRLGKRSGELVEVESGLTKDDWIVTTGLQRLRPGATVNAKDLPMPGTVDAKKK
jgi:RND family efflux transporter MFP subunit